MTELPAWFSRTLELNEFEERLKSKDYLNTVYVLDDKVIGYMSLKNKNHIYHLFVESQHQSKGIANALWQNLLKISNEPKYTVRSSLFAAPVYESFGFKTKSPIIQKDNISYQEMELYA